MLLEGLKITATDGTATFVPSNDVQHVKTAAPTGNSPFVQGKITEVKYNAGATTVPAIAAWNGANILYEYGGYDHSGIFVRALSN
jgi:hypothetical protein